MAKNKLTVLAFVPGMLFWPLVVAGVVTKNDTMIGAAVGIAAVTVITLITLKVRSAAAEKARTRRIWETGHVARAKVVAISTKGGGVNENPLVDLELDVTVDGQPTYRATTSAIISQLAIPRIQPACEIAVRVDRHDAQGVIIDPALTPYGH